MKLLILIILFNIFITEVYSEPLPEVFGGLNSKHGKRDVLDLFPKAKHEFFDKKIKWNEGKVTVNEHYFTVARSGFLKKLTYSIKYYNDSIIEIKIEDRDCPLIIPLDKTLNNKKDVKSEACLFKKNARILNDMEKVKDNISLVFGQPKPTIYGYSWSSSFHEIFLGIVDRDSGSLHLSFQYKRKKWKKKEEIWYKQVINKFKSWL